MRPHHLVFLFILAVSLDLARIDLMEQDRRIKVTKNGPYIVTGDVPFDIEKMVLDKAGIPSKWQKVASLTDKAPYSLCRCGKSKAFPFCDGTHNVIGFDGTETAAHEKITDNAKVIESKGVTMLDNVTYCASAQFCDGGIGAWMLLKKSQNQTERQLLIEEVSNCPSGRLILIDENGKLVEPEFQQGITLVDDPIHKTKSPLWVKGGIPVESESGQIYEVRNRVTLCNCGKSKNKPFCDGSHCQTDKNR
jgi:CDGSH-type Zn-finger protein